MIAFNGVYFDGRTTSAHQVAVTVSDEQMHLIGRDIGQRDFAVADCVITPPLGSTDRVIRLPDNGRLETGDQEAVQTLEHELGSNRGLCLVQKLERYWKSVAVCLAGLVVFVYLFLGQGLPVMAAWLANAVPSGLMENISRKTFDILDNRYLAQTELDQQRVKELHDIFDGVAARLGSGYNYRLEIRKSDKSIGPNAFALPSGIIIFTDDLINLADDDKEIIGVMAHEIGHVEKRHAMRSVIQNAGVFFVVSALVGDIASITSVAATLPTMLAETGYSRDFEREADLFSGRYLIKQGCSTAPMIAMLEKLAKQDIDFPGMSLLSTHPNTKERIANLQQM